MNGVSPNAERRESLRTDLAVQVLISGPQGSCIVNGWIENISKGGFRLKIETLLVSDIHLSQGDVIYFRTFEEFFCFKGSGEIRWTSPENIVGIKFTALDHGNEEFLQGFLSCLRNGASSSSPALASGRPPHGNPGPTESCGPDDTSCQGLDKNQAGPSETGETVSPAVESRIEELQKNKESVLREFDQLLQMLAQEGRSPPRTNEGPGRMDWSTVLPQSEANGILMTDVVGKTIGYNKKFLEIWKIPDSVIDSQEEDSILSYLFAQLKEPEKFINEIRVCYDQPETKSYDLVELKDGKIVGLISQSRKMEGKSVILIWSFHEISHNGTVESRVSAAL